MERRLATILAIDVVGYSRLMRKDEEGTLDSLIEVRQLIDRLAVEHGGRTFGAAGDSVLAEFSSPVEAVRCSFNIQRDITEANANSSEDTQMQLRIGVNLGDVMDENGALYGDGINVAARLESMSEVGGMCISRSVYDHVRDRIDIKFKDVGEQIFKNIDRPVHAWKWLPPGSAPEKIKPLPLPGGFTAGMGAYNGKAADKPSIAVMPFVCLIDDQGTASMAQGLRIDIQNALIRIAGLGVISVASSNAASNLSPKEAANLLDARYVFHGQVRRAGDRVRFSSQLIDAKDGSIVWSDQLDRKIEDTFHFLDEITSEILTAMSIQLVAGEAARVWHKVLPDLKSIEVFYRGTNNFFRMTSHSLIAARRDFENVARHHPNSSLGATWVSLTHWFELQRGWSSSPEQSHKLAREWAEKATEFEDCDGQACTVLSHLYLLDRDFDAALEAGAAAVLNRPSCANANGFYANVLHYCGQQDAALKHIRLAIRYSPFHPPLFKIVLAAILRAQGNLAEAIRPTLELLNSNDEDIEALVLHTAIEAEQCATKSVVSSGEKITKIMPDFSVRSYLARQPYRRETIPAELSRLLRKAGLPD